MYLSNHTILEMLKKSWKSHDIWMTFCLLGLQQQPGSYRGGDYDNEMSVSLVEETGIPGGNHRPTTLAPFKNPYFFCYFSEVMVHKNYLVAKEWRISTFLLDKSWFPN